MVTHSVAPDPHTAGWSARVLGAYGHSRTRHPGGRHDLSVPASNKRSAAAARTFSPMRSRADAGAWTVTELPGICPASSRSSRGQPVAAVVSLCWDDRGGRWPQLVHRGTGGAEPDPGAADGPPSNCALAAPSIRPARCRGPMRTGSGASTCGRRPAARRSTACAPGSARRHDLAGHRRMPRTGVKPLPCGFITAMAVAGHHPRRGLRALDRSEPRRPPCRRRACLSPAGRGLGPWTTGREDRDKLLPGNPNRPGAGTTRSRRDLPTRRRRPSRRTRPIAMQMGELFYDVRQIERGTAGARLLGQG